MDLFVDRAHVLAVAYELAGIAGKHVPELTVLLDKGVTLRTLLAACGGGLRGDVGDDLQESHVLHQRACVGTHLAVHRKSPHDLPQIDEGHADEGDRLVAGAAPGLVQKTLVLADIQHNLGLACLRNQPGNALAYPVTAKRTLLGIQCPGAGLNPKLVPLQQGKGPPLHPKATLQYLYHFLQKTTHVALTDDNRRDLAQYRYLV